MAFISSVMTCKETRHSLSAVKPHPRSKNIMDGAVCYSTHAVQMCHCVELQLESSHHASGSASPKTAKSSRLRRWNARSRTHAESAGNQRKINTDLPCVLR